MCLVILARNQLGDDQSPYFFSICYFIHKIAPTFVGTMLSKSNKKCISD
jgi:hypothetical protein